MASKKSAQSKCAVTRGEIDLDYYESQDSLWREMGLAAPARRALVNAGIIELRQLTKFTSDEIADLHGMGPKAIVILETQMKAKKLSFRKI